MFGVSFEVFTALIVQSVVYSAVTLSSLVHGYQYIPLKGQYPPTELHHVTTQKTTILDRMLGGPKSQSGPLKYQININNVQKFNIYLTENTIHLLYKDKPVNDV
jgi:hypothetical protein